MYFAPVSPPYMNGRKTRSQFDKSWSNPHIKKKNKSVIKRSNWHTTVITSTYILQRTTWPDEINRFKHANITYLPLPSVLKNHYFACKMAAVISLVSISPNSSETYLLSFLLVTNWQLVKIATIRIMLMLHCTFGMTVLEYNIIPELM